MIVLAGATPGDLEGEIAGFLGPAERILSIEPAGEGNMNCVRRIRTTLRTAIVKQARPFVERYPSIAAPVSRSEAEAKFLVAVSGTPAVASRMPTLWHHAPGLLVIEDLGEATDLGGVYPGTAGIEPGDLRSLAEYQSALQNVPIANPKDFENRAMRELNHEHIFRLPFSADQGLLERLESLTPGLAAIAGEVSRNERLVRRASELGRRYLEQTTTTLIHGDFFFGSFLRHSDGGLRVIDPEFSFCGDPEFDSGVLLAHILLANLGETSAEAWQNLAPVRDPSLRDSFAGIEILRRLLGVAQLPLAADLDRKRALIDRGISLALGE